MLTKLRSQRLKLPHGFRVSGIAQFNATDSTGELPCELASLYSFVMTPIGPPAQVSGTSVIDEQTTSLAAISATQKFEVHCPVAGTIAFSFEVSATLAVDAANIWTIGVVNKTQAGAVIVDSTSAANSNNSAGGSAFTAFTPFIPALTVNTTVAAGDVLEVTLTKASAAANLVEFNWNSTISQTNSSEKSTEVIFLDEAAQVNSNGILACPNNGTNGGHGTLTISRSGPAALTPNLLFSFEYWGT